MEHAANEPPPIPRRCVIVAGMHRSGTSATTRVVNLLGADIASAMLPVTPGDNDRGYWESAAVVEIHDQLLRALGSAFDDPFPLPERWLDSRSAREAQHRLAEEIRRDFDGSRVFVVKDPRTTRFLPLWLDLLDQLAIEPVVVIPVRNPLEVAASLERRAAHSVPPAQSLLLYVRSYLDAELASRGRRRLFVRYEQLLTNWRRFATELGNIVGTQFQFPAADRAAAIDEFLTADLYHCRASREQLARAPEVAAIVVEMFDLMTAAADTGDEASLRRSFDRLRTTASEATKLFQGIVLSEKALVAAEVAKSATLSAALAEMRDRLTERESGLAERSAELTAARRDALALQAELAAARSDAVALQAQLEARSDRMARLSRELASLQDLAWRSEALLEAAGKELDAVTQSTIWRLTEPLRRGAASFPGLSRRVRRCLALIWRAGAQAREQMRLRRDSGWSVSQARHARAAVVLSGLFDERWYKETYPDVAASGVDPIEHYLSCGADEGRDPGPLFNTLAYLSRTPEACAEGQNPLLHYIKARERAGATDPVGAAGFAPVPTLAHSSAGRLLSALSKRSNEEEVVVLGVSVEKWRTNFPRI